MTAAHQIDEHVVHKIEIMAYTLNPSPSARVIKKSFSGWVLNRVCFGKKMRPLRKGETQTERKEWESRLYDDVKIQQEREREWHGTRRSE